MFTLGLDYGTNSVRALIVRCSDGAEYGSRVVDYPSGAQGILLDPKDGLLARQHPPDYLFGLEESVKGALAEARRKPDFDAAKIVGIGVDTTGSSPIPVDARNQALASDPKWKTDLNAQCWLWKDHTSWREAARITELSARLRPQYIAKCGGVYSSEWFWAKIWHCLNVAPEVFGAAFSWVELADWIPSVLAGVTDPRLVKRGVCAAGHKALYSDEWGGLPGQGVSRRARSATRRPRATGSTRRPMTRASRRARSAREWAAKLGLPAGIPIAIGEFDVHYGAIGCGVARGHARQGHRHLDLRLRGRFGRQNRSPTFPASAASSKARSCPASSASRPASRRSATSSNGGSRWSAAATPRCTPNSRPKRRSSSRARPVCSRSTGTTATAPFSSISA